MLDSYNHLGASLAKMVEELRKSCLDFDQESKAFEPLLDWINKKYADRDETLRKQFFQALLKKQFFPYRLLSDVARLKETKLPEKKDWFDPLKKKATAEEDIAYAEEVFQLFECVNVEEYLKLYLEADIGNHF